MDIQFLGATKTVTGSKYLITADGAKILVDCGLFQGYKELRLRNWRPLPIAPSDIEYVLLTHAHIDHSGYIPLLVKNGFHGKILCTDATYDLCEVLLPDSGHLQEEEAEYANKKGYSKHHPALPLYTRREAEHSLKYFQIIPRNKKFKIKDDFYFSFQYGGHILGASTIVVEHYDVSVLFSGDLGRPDDLLMYPPAKPFAADYLVIESTYGDRLHEEINPLQKVGDVINDTYKKGGTILIPAFAVGRTQTILYLIYKLKELNKIPDIPVYIDSPMATDATKLFYKHAEEHRLNQKESGEVCKTAKYVQSVEDSIALHRQNQPMIIISASGMATGGRVLHHIKHYAPDHHNTILFTGYQAGGTRGDRMLRGEPTVKMLGEQVPIRANIIELEGTSAHADYADMLAWLEKLADPPRKVFITHGEPDSAEALRKKIQAKFNWDCMVPEYLDEVELV